MDKKNYTLLDPDSDTGILIIYFWAYRMIQLCKKPFENRM